MDITQKQISGNRKIRQEDIRHIGQGRVDMTQCRLQTGTIYWGRETNVLQINFSLFEKVETVFASPLLFTKERFVYIVRIVRFFTDIK